MERTKTDIIIAGGGVAGLTAAAAFGAEGFRTICVDPAPPVTDGAAPGADLRTTAFLQPARALLEAAGIWDRLSPEAMPLEIMRIIDAGGRDGEARVSRDFVSADLGDAPFGWNFRNWVLRREILARLDSLPTVDFRPGVGFVNMVPRENSVIVTLSDGQVIEARMLVACDGRDSAVRAACGIGARTLRYGQKALSFAVTHPVPHDNVSTEIHRQGGPFTFVPLPDHEGQPCSAVVWMERGPEAQRLAALPREAFEAEATERSTGLLGALRLVAGPQVWPIISRIADRMDGPRTALMAETAHVVPPIGAQGLNMSLADLSCLLDLARADHDGIGSRKMLATYHRKRHPEIAIRVAGVDALNRASMASSPLLHDLRAMGMRALHDVAPVRKTLMRLGLGLGRGAERPIKGG
ncbi:UbiH/UbiF family hydroxylase [Ponticoccus sp. SC2-23]|nr:UbiH/UbiF family hydroxylase [Ponticoccus sp. SC6-9]MBM1225603.1 UbiH/UbiF family hydroxylase [Ponticoccus sp. SC6-15]MBM1227755.1 UbiH/UbiF family hydroxylase [Ponticoccus sp. SC6-38]MBM1234607.1 UbiH/UbiF family hydroxylase [Ponticoccus sp. SC6-45]MBM1238257.1 UbiH/UbiF family hydroxylase [Ponticoccus sp. SC6-49]MBM1243526.1 UbiH/UbiF family hydroxylase [Ponticoccus sp. SC2-64]MBM1248131.1 UbiH/UbiF family hydroxylase [Ponticoccus sp. SC6-42]MBM1252657.1 UbiH/UbiF family hydroxylase [Po